VRTRARQPASPSPQIARRRRIARGRRIARCRGIVRCVRVKVPADQHWPASL
jgi:hypothetical protein